MTKPPISTLDAQVGARLRRRRIVMKLTQALLADRLGISYQQLQKYERGTNRMPATRLASAAQILGVALEHFLEVKRPPSDSLAVREADALETFQASADAVRLCKAYLRIAEGSERKRLLRVIEALGDGRGGARVADVVHLSSGRRGRRGTDAARKKAANAAMHALKVKLAQHIGRILQQRDLSQVAAARVLNTRQSDVSIVARGGVMEFSVDRLFRYLLLLGWAIDLEIKKVPEDGATARAAMEEP